MWITERHLANSTDVQIGATTAQAEIRRFGWEFDRDSKCLVLDLVLEIGAKRLYKTISVHSTIVSVPLHSGILQHQREAATLVLVEAMRAECLDDQLPPVGVSVKRP